MKKNPNFVVFVSFVVKTSSQQTRNNLDYNLARMIFEMGGPALAVAAAD